MAEDMAKRIQQYVMIRDRLKALDEAHEAARKPLVELQTALSARLEKFMNDNKLENFKSEHGTAYLSIKRTASLSDPDAFMNYVIEHQKFELLDRRANSTAVTEFVAEHNCLPPGCNLNGHQSVGVRRAPGSK